MLIDGLIILFIVSALYRGREIGFVRQLFSTIGFFGGLFLGAALEPHTIQLVHSQSSRGLVTLLTTLGCALIFLTLGEYIGLRLKHRVLLKPVNRYDNGFGGILGIVSLLFSIWLLAAVVDALPFPGLQSAVQQSRIVSSLTRTLPGAPTVIADLGRLIDPNGFPEVFSGPEPTPRSGIDLPSLGDLQPAVDKDKASVVKIEGRGCGGIVEGSGFVADEGLVVTNAHVVAGIKLPYVQDSNGTHRGTVIHFDPNLDLAVLRVSNLNGRPLMITTRHNPPGTPAAVLGYPGGGAFTARAAAVLNQFNATGRNIYDKGSTAREVYELQSIIIPGNSGGPLVGKDGAVIGVIFAESTTYNHVGYALTTPQVINGLSQAKANGHTVGTGRCTE